MGHRPRGLRQKEKRPCRNQGSKGLAHYIAMLAEADCRTLAVPHRKANYAETE